jgi:hypothetical protein
MKYSCPSYLIPVIPRTPGTGGNDREWAEFQGVMAMNKSLPGAPDLFGMESHDKRTNDRPEAAALCEVLKALKAHPAVSWCERMNSGAARVGGRFIRFGFTGCPDVLGMLRDGRLLGVEVKAAKGKLRPEQAVMLERIRTGGGVSFVARDCRDVIRELKGQTQ